MILVDVYDGQAIRAGALVFLYELLAERPQGSVISHAKMPSFEQHRAFVTSRIYRAWFIIEDENTDWVGALQVTHQNEIGVSIRRTHQRRGHAFAAVRRVMAMLKPNPYEPALRAGRWLANVAPGNAASHALFKKLGGREIQITYEL